MTLRSLLSICLALRACAGLLPAQDVVPPGKATGDEPAPAIKVQPAQLQPQVPDKNAWFPQVNRDLGTYFTEEKAAGKFSFKNPTDTEQRFTNIIGSCACAKAMFTLGDRIYILDKDPVANSLHRLSKKDGQEVRERVTHITVEPHQEGLVEVQMDMHGVRGTREASLDIQTTDASTPHVKLSWRATGAVFFEVTPPDTQLGEMTWKDKREFQFEIASPLREDFNITGHEPLAAGLAISYEKTTRNGRAVWVVKGTYGPGVDERQNGAVIRFNTDLDQKQVEGRIVAFVKGPLSVEPGGFISFGHVPMGTAKSKTIRITPTDDFVLGLTKFEFEDLKVPEGSADKLQIRTEQSERSLLVHFTVAEGMPRAIIRGKLKLHLNHPAAPVKEFLFNGFVR